MASRRPSPPEGFVADSYWKATLNVNDKDYKRRCQIILDRSRARWPRDVMLRMKYKTRQRDCSAWILLDVREFEDYKAITDSATARLQLLENYVDFAFFLNFKDKPMPTTRTENKTAKRTFSAETGQDGADQVIRIEQSFGQEYEAPTSERPAKRLRISTTRALAPLLATIQEPIITIEDSSPPERQPEGKVEARSHTTTEPTQDRHNIRSTTSSPPLSNNADQAFDWSDVQIKINANVLDAGTIWIPMLDLLPESITNPSWHDFSIDALYRQFKIEAGKGLDPAWHDLVQLDSDKNGEAQEFVVKNLGAYRIMLKRFMKTAVSVDNVLHLEVRARE